MAYWLMKSEPEAWSWDQQKREGAKGAEWDGVRNFQARNMLRDEMRRGDQAFLYHSSCEVPGIVAVMDIVKEGYPDPTAFDRRNDHYDPRSDPRKPRWYMVDVRLKRRLARTIALEELRKHAARELKGMVLLRPGNRLSVMPVEPAHWKFILALE